MRIKMNIPPEGIPIKKIIYKVIIPVFAVMYVIGFYWARMDGTAGILDMNSSGKILLSKKDLNTILLKDDARRDFVILEKTDSSDLIMRTIDYGGKEIERTVLKLLKDFDWDPRMYALSPDRNRFAYFTWKAVIVHDLRTSEETEILKAKEDFDLSPAGLKWVTNSEVVFQGGVDSIDAHIIKYDVDRKGMVKKIKFKMRPEYFNWPESKYSCLLFSDGDGNKEFKIFDPEKMEIIATYIPHNPQVSILTICVSPSGQRLAFTEFRGKGPLDTLNIADLKTGEEKSYIQCHVCDPSFLDDDTLVYTHYYRFNPFSMGVRRLDVNTGAERVLVRPNFPPTKLIGIDNGNKLLFSAW